MQRQIPASPLPKRPLDYRWIVLAACLIFLTTSSGMRFSFGVFFKPLEQDFALTRAQTSGVFSLLGLASSVFALLAGIALDKYGPKAVYAVMGLFTALSLFLTSRAESLSHLYLTYSLLLAIGTGPGYVVVTSMASKWFPDKRGLAIGIATSGIGLGTVIMSPVADRLIAGYGWRGSYLALAAIALLVMVPCAQLVRRSPGEVRARAKSEAPGPPGASSQSEAGAYSVRQALANRDLWLVLSIWFLCSWSIFIVMAHVVRHGIDLGFTSMQASSVLSVVGGANIFGRLIMGRVSDSIGRKQAALICALLLSAAMLFLTMASNLWMFYMFAVVFGFSFGGISPPIAAFIGETFGLRHLGAIMGIVEIGFTAGSAFGPLFAGYVFDASGNYVFAFLSGTIAMVLVAALICFLRGPIATRRRATSRLSLSSLRK